jgi:hypothetical protein
MAKKRGNSEGSIYQMKDGRWRAAVSIGKDGNGRPKRKVFTASTRHEVADELKTALARPAVRHQYQSEQADRQAVPEQLARISEAGCLPGDIYQL